MAEAGHVVALRSAQADMDQVVSPDTLEARSPPLPGGVFRASRRCAGLAVEALQVAAQIAIGASLGLRFRLQSFRTLPRAALAGIFSGVVLIGVSGLLFAAAVQALGGLRHETATMAVMPGGLGEMIASATALGVLPATVAGFQITRSILTNIFTPPLIKFTLGRLNRSGSNE